MAIPVLLILAALWAAVLVPPLLRARADRATPVGDFASRLDVLGRAVPSSRARRPMAHHSYAVGLARTPGGMSPVQRRRRDVLAVLGTLTGACFLLLLFSRSTVTFGLFVLAFGCTIAYVAMLVQIRRREQDRKYRRLDRAIAAPSPSLARAPRVRARVDAPTYRRAISATH